MVQYSTVGQNSYYVCASFDERHRQTSSLCAPAARTRHAAQLRRMCLPMPHRCRPRRDGQITDQVNDLHKEVTEQA